MKNDRRMRGDVTGIIAEALSACVDMPSGSNATYDIRDLADGMMRSAILDATVGGSANGMGNAAEVADVILRRRIPSDQWFNDTMSRTNAEAAIGSFAGMVSRLLSMLAKLDHLPKKGLTIAIDMHLIPRYDRVPGPELTRSRSKDGTGLFERYITAQCVDDDLRLVLGCLPVPAGESVPEMVRGLLGLVREAGAKIKLVLLDREFFSTGVIRALTGMNVDYLMPCPNTPGVVEALNEFAAGQRQAVSDHILEGSGRRVPYHLVIADRKRKGKKPATLPKERFIGFATSLPDIDVNLYSARWGIETGYSMIEAMRTKTRSRDPGARLLCFLYSLMVFNGWVMVNALKQYHSQARLKGGRRMTQTTLKILLLMAAGSRILPDPPPDALPSG